MGDLAELFVSFVICTVGGYLLVTLDERRLGPVEDARAWPATSKIAAFVAFGPIAIPVHFVRTRRSFRGVLFGLAALVAVIGLSTLASAALSGTW